MFPLGSEYTLSQWLQKEPPTDPHLLVAQHALPPRIGGFSTWLRIAHCLPSVPQEQMIHISLRCYVIHYGLSPWPHPLFREWFVAISFRGSPEFEDLAIQCPTDTISLDDYITDENFEVSPMVTFTLFSYKGDVTPFTAVACLQH